MKLNDEIRRPRLVGALTTLSVVALSFSGFTGVAHATEDTSAETASPVAESSTANASFHTSITVNENRAYKVGEKIYFQIYLRNDSEQSLGVQITNDTETNLQNIGKCRWSQFRAKDQATCRTQTLMPYHEVTVEDARTGQFTPRYSLSTYQPFPGGNPQAYKQLVAKLPTVTGAPVQIAPLSENSAQPGETTPPVSPTPAPTPAPVPAPAPPAPTPPVVETQLRLAEITFQLRSEKTGPWTLNDLLEYTIHVKNVSGKPRGFTPTAGNLDKWEKCKWTRAFPDQTTKSDCNFVTHRITQEDVNNGYFEPFITYEGVPKATGSRVLIRPQTITMQAGAPTGVQTQYALGNELRFPVAIVNHSAEPLTLQTGATNLTFTGEKCNATIGAKQTHTCETASHRLTEEDLEAGFFKPELNVTAATANGEVVGFASLVTEPVALPNNHTWPKAAGFTPHDYDPTGNTASGLTSEVIIAQQNGRNYYRIPALTVAANGDLLASYDHRPNHAGDTPNANSIVQRRSKDNGRTWGPETFIAKATGTAGRDLESFSDPSYVVDYATGKIFNFHVKGYDRGWGNAQYYFNGDKVQVGHRHSMDLHVSVSDDNGRTWTHKVITDQLLNGRTDAVKAFATSGDGMQIQHGTYKGRLVQPAAWGLRNGTVVAGVIYSDNHGQTWQLGKWTPVAGEGGNYRWDENKIVELSDGRLMINSRVSGGPANQARVRAVAYSADGGVTWGNPKPEHQLTDPVNNAHIIRAFPTAAAGTAKAKVLLFSNSKNRANRTNGTITVSCDDGKTWNNQSAKEYYSGHMGYSSLAVLNDGSVGVLSEVAGHSIRFQRFDSTWLGAQCQLTDAAVSSSETNPESAPLPDFSVTVTPKQRKTYALGEKIWFRIQVRNNADKAYGLQIAADDTNLSRTDKCRWSTFNASQSGDCNSENLMAWHIVTNADVKAGSFTPHYALSLYEPQPSSSSTRYTQLVHKLPKVTLDSIPVTAGAPKAEVTIRLNNPKTTPWIQGETLRYSVLVKNTSGVTRGFQPESSNLTGFERCKWSTGFANGATKSDCDFLTHEISEADVAAGFFQPRIKYREVAETIGEKVSVRPPSITLTQTGLTGVKDSYQLGDTLTFTFKVAAQGKTPVTVESGETNLSFAAGACNGELAVGSEKTCATATHVIDETDLEAKEFTPTLRISALENGKTVQVLDLRAQAIALPNQHAWAKATAFTAHNFAPTSEAAGGLSAEKIIASHHGKTYYRIPSLTVASNGDLLASYDLRPNGAADTPNPNSIVQRRSKDNGLTWGPETFISKTTGRHGVDLDSYSDPSYIVDYKSGKIFNFHVKGHNRGWHNGAKFQFDAAGSTVDNHPDAMDIHVAVSDDNGHTWTHRVLTKEILRGRIDAVKAFATSGGGIQIQHGKYAGRLIQPSVWSLSDGTVRAASIYSDDQGVTWKLGNWAPASVGTVSHRWDENKVVELADGRIMVNSRVAGGPAHNARVRLVAYSEDGGVTWGAPHAEDQLIDPVNNAHVIRAFPAAAPGSAAAEVLFFSNAKSKSGRVNGTITVSCDSGRTWNNAEAKTYFSEYMGYSSLAILPDGTVGVLSEGNNSSIRFQRFDSSWLGQQCDLSADKPVVSDSTADTPVEAGSSAVSSLALAVSELRSGEDIVISQGGFTPGTVVTVELHSTPIVLGTATVTAAGFINFSAPVPANAEVGNHHVRVFDADRNLLAEAAVVVAAPVRKPQPSSGSFLKPELEPVVENQPLLLSEAEVAVPVAPSVVEKEKEIIPALALRPARPVGVDKQPEVAVRPSLPLTGASISLFSLLALGLGGFGLLCLRQRR